MLSTPKNLDSQLCEVNLDDPIFYVNPLLAAVERFLAAETSTFATDYKFRQQHCLPSASTTPIISTLPALRLCRADRFLKEGGDLAFSNLSLSQAELLYPYLFGDFRADLYVRDTTRRAK